MGLNVEQQLGCSLARARLRAQDDPLYLGSEILGYHYLRQPAEFHREMADALRKEENLLTLAPRGHIKTTFQDIVGGIFYNVRHKNSRQLIATATLQNSMHVLREIRWHYDENETFRAVFPDFATRTKEEAGNMHSFTVPNRTSPHKEASFEVAGQDAAITGRHYEVIRATDLVIRENVPPAAQPEQMERTLEWFRTFSALLDQTDPKAHRTVDGTRWHDGDLYGYMLREPAYQHFRQIVVGIKEQADGTPIALWDRIPAETLKQIKLEAGQYLWAANYKNDPLPADGVATFRREWFRVYNGDPPPGLDIGVTVDLAISEKTTADRTAIVVSGVAPTGDLYVLAYRAGRYTPRQSLDMVLELAETWKAAFIGIESVAWQKAFVYMVEAEMRQRRLSTPIKELKPDANKIRRASVLSTHAERYGIFVRPEHTDLVDEFLRFPVGAHDDLVDALAYRGQDLIPPRLIPIVQQRPLTIAPETVSGADLINAIEKRGAAPRQFRALAI